MRKALITGITGQDGAWLAKLLLQKGYEVWGVYRRVSSPNFWRLQTLEILDKVKLIQGDVNDMASVLKILHLIEPDEVYHLAAQSQVAASFDMPLETINTDGLSTAIILEALRIWGARQKGTRFYFAGSSEMFGNTKPNSKGKIDENCPFVPASPYAAAKILGYHVTRIYREAYGIFAVTGLLFNHESELRGLEFVTRKISNAVAKIKLGLQKDLLLGNLEARRDWGYAPEYVEAMWLMLQQDQPEDYVIATGETHSVREFVELAFEEAGLDWRDYVRVDNSLMRPRDVNILIGDYSKAEQKLGWRPRTSFKDLVRIMVQADIKRWRQWLEGKPIPFDAPFYEDVYIVSKR
jgi:GDPmannose 4,6-dehydratase